ncbi:MAG: hypothetical protein V4710_14450, partial [Verrucomicrobiota bacterium]
PLPEATPIGLAEVLDGKWDCQRVSLRGVVQFAANHTETPGQGRFDLVGHGGRIPVYSQEPLAEPARMVDSELEASGVVFTYFNHRGELVGARLMTAGSADWHITRAGSVNPFDATQVPLATLRPFSPSGL